MQQVYKITEEKMNKTVQAMLANFGSIRAGRASASVLDRVTVNYYGCPTPVNQMANVSTPEPRMLMIQPYDKSTLRDIERAILTSDIGINPQNDGMVIRMAFPPLTEERRREIGKNISRYAEEAKVAIRSIRRDGLEKLKGMKRDAVITEDDLKVAEKKMQDYTDDFCKEIDRLAAAKEKEIMEM